jgi:uncharacterized protein (TIRG00374 family)
LIPSEFSRSSLLKGVIRTAALIGVLVLIVLLAPGLGEVRDRLDEAEPAWLGLALAFEALSFGSYVLMFAPIFCRGMSMRRSWQIAGSELAMGAIVPASGIGGLALGAWVLHEGGMSVEHIARRSVAFFLIKSSVNFAAVAVLGIIAFCGVGPDLSPALTILPATLSIALIGAVVLIPRIGTGREPTEDDSKPRRIWLRAREALVTGTTESWIVLKRRDWRVLVGAIGYWAFDNAVLYATFAAFGFEPALMVVLLGYLIGQLGGLLPIPGGIGGIDGGLIGTLIVYGAPAAVTAAAVLAYRIILFWLTLLLGAIAFFQLLRDMPKDGELSIRGSEGPAV